MLENPVLQKFLKFKVTIISADIPSNLLLDMVESFITSDDEPTIEAIPVMDGQLSLFDVQNKELISA